jgi:chromosome segregation ATPase
MPLGHDGAARDANLVSALAARIAEIEDIVRTTTQVVDEKTLKELRRTLEAISKRDPKFEERVTNTVDVLADRIEHVAKTVSTSSAALAAKDGEIAQLRRDLEGSLQKVNGAIAAAGRGTDPAEVVEFRRRLDELTKVARERMPRGLEGRIDELEAKFTLVAQRIDSVSSTISTTAAGLAGRDGEINALRRAFEAESDRVGAELTELRRGNDPTAVTDLRQALKEFADETSRRQHAVHNQLGQAGTRVEALAEKLEALSTSVAAATSRVSGTEENLSAFRAYFEDAGGRLSTLISEHHRSLATLSSQAAAADAERAQALERLQHVGDKLGQVIDRVETMEQANVEAARFLDARMDARDEVIRAMELRFQDATTRVDELVADLSRALAELPDPARVDEALLARIDEVAELNASSLSALDEQLSAVRSRFEDARGDLRSLIAQQNEMLAELDTRTAVLEEAGGHATNELDTRVVSMSSRLDGLAREFEASASATSATAARVSGAEEEISGLRDYVEKAGSRLNSLVVEHGRTLAALDTRTAALMQSDAETGSKLDGRISATVDRIDELERKVDAAQAHDDLEAKLEELSTRLRAAEDDRLENASEIARVAAILEVERAALRTKLDLVAGAVETSAGAPDAEEVERRLAALADRVEALDGERASSQAQFEAIAKALSSIPQRSALEQRLEELSRRLDEVEQRGAVVATKVSHASALLPTALRSLEARLDEVAPGSRPPTLEPDVPVEQTAPPVEEPEAGRAVDTVDHAAAAVVHLRASDP